MSLGLNSTEALLVYKLATPLQVNFNYSLFTEGLFSMLQGLGTPENK